MYGEKIVDEKIFCGVRINFGPILLISTLGITVPRQRKELLLKLKQMSSSQEEEVVYIGFRHYNQPSPINTRKRKVGEIGPEAKQSDEEEIDEDFIMTSSSSLTPWSVLTSSSLISSSVLTSSSVLPSSPSSPSSTLSPAETLSPSSPAVTASPSPSLLSFVIDQLLVPPSPIFESLPEPDIDDIQLQLNSGRYSILSPTELRIKHFSPSSSSLPSVNVDDDGGGGGDGMNKQLEIDVNAISSIPEAKESDEE
jgi:hypothetical protein